MEAPKQVSKEQYAWCLECEGYIFARALTKRESIFSDDPLELECPRGHTVLKGEEAGNFVKTNAKFLDNDGKKEEPADEKSRDQEEKKKEKSFF